MRIQGKVRAAIESIPESGWTPIPYWDALEELDIDGERVIVASSAEVAETTYTYSAFSDARHEVTARLLVRRLRRLRPRAG